MKLNWCLQITTCIKNSIDIPQKFQLPIHFNVYKKPKANIYWGCDASDKMIKKKFDKEKKVDKITINDEIVISLIKYWNLLHLLKLKK